jgi:hypothetical protein
MFQQVLWPVAPTMIQDEDFRWGSLCLGDQGQEKARLVHFIGPETNAFHDKVGPFGEACDLDLAAREWRLFERFLVLPACRRKQGRHQCQALQSPTVHTATPH